MLVLDTVAATTLAAPYSTDGRTQWSVEATIKSLVGMDADTLRGFLANDSDSLTFRKARFVAQVALRIQDEREAAHAEALAMVPAQHACDGGCFGGQRLLSGCIENGKPKGAMGVCYRCGGKGWQSDADRKRNYGYDNYYRRVSA